MTATHRLRMRAEKIVDEVENRIRDEGGEVIGTITEIRRYLGIDCLNSELREALSILCSPEQGRLRGAPLDALSQSRGLPYKMYRYVLVSVYA